ncbi:MAG: leucine-rich repeat protein [Spirochaetaceae bacterium]|jgi:hypothetical protein|nr:leucine-rich repeat protein [Spirochaetaceae bacterium]
MKKSLPLFIWIALLCAGVLFLLLPFDSNSKKKQPVLNTLAQLSIPRTGAYLDGTIIEIDTEDAADIYYTIDGAEPDTNSLKYDEENLPKMAFEEMGVPEFTFKTVAVKDSKKSPVEQAVYSQYSITLPPLLRTLADQINANGHGLNKNDPVKVVVPAEVSVDDVKISYPNPGNPELTITDGLGALYHAFQGKFVSLDLSAVNWIGEDDDGNMVKTIHGISNNEGIAVRANKESLVELILPPDLVTIGARAFALSVNLKAIDLKDQSSLKIIESSAFSECIEAVRIDFTGCSSLETISDRAFEKCYMARELDFSPCIKLETVMHHAFSQPRKAKFIEFPMSLMVISDYSFQYAINADYVRFRSPEVPGWGWAAFNYFNRYDWQEGAKSDDPKYGNGLKPTHRHTAPEGGLADYTDKMLVVYHPNSSSWIKPHGGYYIGGDAGGYYFAGQNVPEDSIGDQGANYRGLSSITINAAGLEPRYNDRKITANVAEIQAQIIDGAVTFTIGTPTKNLEILNAKTGQKITFPPHNVKATDKWPQTGEPDVYNGNSGYLGEPYISKPDVKFAILNLTIEGGGELKRFIECKTADEWKHIDADKRTVKYIYVSKDVIIHCDHHNDSNNSVVSTILIELKQGWNLVEICERTFDILNANTENPGVTKSVWISGCKYDSEEIKSADEFTQNRRQYDKVIPWMISGN